MDLEGQKGKLVMAIREGASDVFHTAHCHGVCCLRFATASGGGVGVVISSTVPEAPRALTVTRLKWLIRPDTVNCVVLSSQTRENTCVIVNEPVAHRPCIGKM